MISYYTIRNNKLQDGQDTPVWIDLNEPTKEEEKIVEAMLGIEVPTREEMAALELSNRLYQEDSAVYLGLTLLTHADTHDPKNEPYTFIITDKCLVTIRYAETSPFTVTMARLQKNKAALSLTPVSIALALLEAMTNRMADIMETSAGKIDRLSKSIFHPHANQSDHHSLAIDLHGVLRETGIQGDILSKVKESLINLNRLTGYATSLGIFHQHDDDAQHLKTLFRDISALNDHAGFLTGKIGFLMEATMGMIGMQQNAILKIFSVGAVMFLPPTLVASVYGMNFRHMPELDWQFGYPLAIGLMILSGLLPYRYFRHKGWL